MSSVDLVAKVAQVLRALARSEPGGCTTSEAARNTIIPRATTHRLLSTLQAEGLVDRTKEGRWILGPEAYLLGVAASPRHDISSRAQPVVRQLSQVTGESAFYSVRRGDETVCLIAEEGSFPLRSHVLHVSKRFPLGVASAGIVMLALMEPSWASAYLSRVDLEKDYGPAYSAILVEQRLAEARTVGYSVNPGLVVEGSWGMAAAVLDDRDQPIGALSLTGVESRFSAARITELGDLLLQAAHPLSARPRSAQELQTLRRSGAAW